MSNCPLYMSFIIVLPYFFPSFSLVKILTARQYIFVGTVAVVTETRSSGRVHIAYQFSDLYFAEIFTANVIN